MNGITQAVQKRLAEMRYGYGASSIADESIELLECITLIEAILADIGDDIEDYWYAKAALARFGGEEGR